MAEGARARNAGIAHPLEKAAMKSARYALSCCIDAKDRFNEFDAATTRVVS